MTKVLTNLYRIHDFGVFNSNTMRLYSIENKNEDGTSRKIFKIG